MPHQPTRAGTDKTWASEAEAILKNYAKANPADPAPFSFVFFTNFAWHFRGRQGAHTAEHIFSFVPSAAHQISQKHSMLLGGRCKDAPRIEPPPVEIPFPEETKIMTILGIWFEPIEHEDALNSFERMDVAPRSDEHRFTHFDLLASSRTGIAAETKIRVHVIYESD